MSSLLPPWSQRLLDGISRLITLLVTIHILGQLFVTQAAITAGFVFDVVGRFGLDNELSIPTWLSAALGMTIALLCWLIARNNAKAASHKAWMLISFTGLFIAIDEVASLHELILQGLHLLVGFSPQQSLLQNAWLLVMPFIAAGALLLVKYVKKTLPARTVRQLTIAGCLYLFGAVIIEYLGADMDKARLTYRIGEVVAEELCEFVGLWLLIRAIMNHISTYEKSLVHKLNAMLK